MSLKNSCPWLWRKKRKVELRRSFLGTMSLSSLFFIIIFTVSTGRPLIFIKFWGLFSGVSDEEKLQRGIGYLLFIQDHRSKLKYEAAFKQNKFFYIVGFHGIFRGSGGGIHPR